MDCKHLNSPRLVRGFGLIFVALGDSVDKRETRNHPLNPTGRCFPLGIAERYVTNGPGWMP